MPPAEGGGMGIIMRNFITDYEERERVFVDKEGTPITNGIFKATKYKKIKSGKKTSNIVEVEFITDTEKETVEIPFDILQTSKLCKYIPEYFFVYIETGTFKEKFTRARIMQDLKNLPIDEFYALEQGHNIIEDKHIFCLGNDVINPINDIKYIPTSDKSLKPSNEKENYLKWIYKFCSLDKDNMPVLLLSVIVAIIRPLLKEAGINDLFVTYIYGETGKGKSTYSKLLTEIYANTKNYLTLSSDIIGLRELMLQTKDFVMLADDLNISGSSRIQASKEAKISEIIQQAANGDKVKYKKEESYFEGLLFVTAEYVLNSQSTINRCILVNIVKNMNTGMLDYLKENQGLYIKFIKDFIKYIYNNFANIVKDIKYCNVTRQTQRNNNEDAFAGIMRIKRTEKTLRIAFRTVTNFLKEEIQVEDYILDKIKEMFQNSITTCINNTKEYVRKENTEAGTKYIDKIIELLPTISDNQYDYLYGQPYYAKNYKEYLQRNENDNTCYLFKNKDCICFKGEDIIDYFKKLDDFNYIVTKQAISAQLKYHGLLKSNGGEYSFPCKSAKSKERYYHIDIEKLAEFIFPDEDYAEEKEEFIKSL